MKTEIIVIQNERDLKAAQALVAALGHADDVTRFPTGPNFGRAVKSSIKNIFLYQGRFIDDERLVCDPTPLRGLAENLRKW